MKKTLFRLAPLFVIAFTFLFSLKGNAQSLYKDLYPNGKIRSIGKFNVVGKEDSIWKFYYEDGTLQEESTYRNGYFNGKVFRYHTNGKLQVEGYFRFGQEDSIQRTFNEKGIKIQEGNFLKGKKNGEWSAYYNNGKLNSVLKYDTSGVLLVSYFDNKEKQTISNGNGVLPEVNEEDKILVKDAKS